jgi:hypothetical protein
LITRRGWVLLNEQSHCLSPLPPAVLRGFYDANHSCGFVGEIHVAAEFERQLLLPREAMDVSEALTAATGRLL